MLQARKSPRLVAVAEPVHVHLQVPEAGQHGHALGGDDLGIRRHHDRVDRADGADALALDDDHAVHERRVAVTVHDGAAGKDQRPPGEGRRAGQQRGGDEQCATAHDAMRSSSRASVGGRCSMTTVPEAGRTTRICGVVGRLM